MAEDGSAVMCVFDRALERFAAVTHDHRLRVWSTSTGKLLHSYTHPSHLYARYTSIAWRVLPKRTSKRRRDVIALGTTHGKVVCWDTLGGQVCAEIDTGRLEGAGQCVYDVAFNDVDGSLWCGGDGARVYRFDRALGPEPVQHLEVGAAGCARLCVAPPDGQYLATANRAHVTVWELASRQVLFRVTAHTSDIRALVACPPLPGADMPAYLLSSGAEERVASVWAFADNAGRGDKVAVRKPAHALSCHAPPLACDLAWVGGDGGEGEEVGRKRKAGSGGGKKGAAGSGAAFYSLAVEPARAVVFALPSSGKGKPRTCELAARSGGDVPFLFGCIAGDGAALLVRGTYARPHFETVRFLDDDGELKESVALAALSEAQLAVNTSADKSTTKAKKDFVVASQRKTPKPALGVPLPDANGGRSRTALPSFAEQLESLGMLKPREAEAAAVAASSLQSVLQQALKTNDQQLLESCLSVADADVITNTVRRLPRASVLPFLDVIVARFESKPSHAHKLVMWLQPLLAHHASYLMGLSNNESLGALLQTVESRASIYAPILKLNGRLEFLLSQITARKEATSYDNVARITEDEILSESDDDELDADDMSEVDAEFSGMVMEDDEVDEDEEEDDEEDGGDEDEGEDEDGDEDSTNGPDEYEEDGEESSEDE